MIETALIEQALSSSLQSLAHLLTAGGLAS